MSHRSNRRDFLKTTSTAALAGATLPYWFTAESNRALGFQSVNSRPVLGCIGTGDRWHQVVGGALNHSDGVAVCDVDRLHMEQGRDKVKDIQAKKGKDATVEMYEDYRKLLDRKDIDVVTIVTCDHWHSKIAIEAMRAGKDVYCEKPLTLTINEGKQIRKVLQETKRVFQVGTQQRSEMGLLFLKAVAMVKDGRIGKVQKVTCDIGGAPGASEIPEAGIPAELNWDMWLGQAPMVKYRSKGSGGKYPHARTHYEFRWWYEYSGGKMTDWGAHHVDIASWALGIDESGPLSVEGVATHPCEFKDGHPLRDDCYNAATSFDVTVMCPGDVEMHIVSNSKDGNGILFEGTEGRFHVSRGNIKGKPVEDLKEKPLSEDLLSKLYKGKKPGNHMGNFFECIADRSDPISDVYSHHRAMTTCHLANIAIRLGRKITWDSKTEQIVGDPAANQWLAREQRKGYEIDVSV
ncbi:MAG: twin-arginine translocation signal domain-containing protein [Planctomycetota bacterium]|nr:Gfo/Idh/MocA family oxidoreductase [Planctomycetales bacterium]RLS43731.1 MAG: twin-arginine translocation signal domain-containing protein [Planctomycetota bacterium]